MIMLLGMPLAFSGLVIAYGFILGYGRAGFVTQLMAGAGPTRPCRRLDLQRDRSGIRLCLLPGAARGLVAIPGFANLDLRPMLAARTLGATRWRAFRDTVLAQVAPSVLANACLVAAIAMGTYGTALALAGTQLNILPLMLYAQIGDGGSDFGVAAALSLLLMALCVAVMGVGDALARRRR